MFLFAVIKFETLSAGEHRSVEGLIQPQAVDLLRPVTCDCEAVYCTVGSLYVNCIYAVCAEEAAHGPLGQDGVLFGDSAGNGINDICGNICEAGELQIGIDLIFFGKGWILFQKKQLWKLILMNLDIAIMFNLID